MTRVLFTPHLGPTSDALQQPLEANGMAVQRGELGLPELSNWHEFDCLVTSPEDFLNYRGQHRDSTTSPKPIVLVASSADVRQAVRCIQQGASDYLPPAPHQDELAAAIERALHKHAQQPKTSNADSVSFTMVGDCPAMMRLRDQIHTVATTDSAVLILGEPGAGKELIARALHSVSHRAQRPLITLNCASIPAQLMEAELFGSIDANGLRSPGLLQAANGGTLFLDEAADMPPEVQARLLTVLEDKKMRPLGGTDYETIDARLLAATHQPLDKLASGSQFRADLYYRLSVFTLEAPPLRERGDDVLMLAETFINKTANKLDKPQVEFTDEAKNALQQYSWPGNVRELANVIERAVILANGAPITTAELAIDTNPPVIVPLPPKSQEDPTTLADYFVKFVTENQDQLTETELAERLGISRKSLWERRQRLNIPRKRTKKRGPRREGI